MTISTRKPIDLSSYGIPSDWIFDSLFQEVNLTSGALIFEWHASEHFNVNETMVPRNGDGETPLTSSTLVAWIKMWMGITWFRRGICVLLWGLVRVVRFSGSLVG